MTLYIDTVNVNGRDVRYLKMSLDFGEPAVITLGWIDNFGTLHVKK